jgi:hypothetical protein
MTRLSSIIALGLLTIPMSVFGSPASIPINNAGFEASTTFQYTYPQWPGQAWNLSVPGWTILNNNPVGPLNGIAGDYRPTEQIVDGTPLYINPYAGLNVAFIAGFPPPSDAIGDQGILQQFLTTNVTPGNEYTLSVAVGREFQFSPEPFGVELLAGGVDILSFFGSTGTITPGSWDLITLTGQAGDVSGPLEIRLSGGGRAGGEVLFDQVSLTDPSVPEPATYSMLMGGIVLLGLGKFGARKLRATK